MRTTGFALFPPVLLRMLVASALVRSSAVYVGSNLLNRAVPFLLIPVLTRYLSPAEMGTVAMFVLAMNLAAPLAGLSTESAIGRRYFDRDRIDFSRYLASCFAVLAVSLSALLLLTWLFGGPLSSALAVPPLWLLIAVLAAGARYVTSTVLMLWQMRQRPFQYALFSFLQTALALGLSVALVVWLGFGWEGRAWGEVAALALFAPVGVVVLLRGGWLRGSPDREYAQDAVRYGAGLIPHLYGGLLIAGTDRLFLTNMVGVDQTGLFVVALQIALIIQVIEHSVNQAWVPWIFGVLRGADPRRLRRSRHIIRAYNVGILGLALLLTAIAPWLLGFFVGPEFRAAGQFIFWLALAGAFSGMYKMVAAHVYYAERTGWLAAISVITGAANIGLNYTLIQRNGAIGAAQATAIAMLLCYLGTAVLSRRAVSELRAAGG